MRAVQGLLPSLQCCGGGASVHRCDSSHQRRPLGGIRLFVLATTPSPLCHRHMVGPLLATVSSRAVSKVVLGTALWME